MTIDAAGDDTGPQVSPMRWNVCCNPGRHEYGLAPLSFNQFAGTVLGVFSAQRGGIQARRVPGEWSEARLAEPRVRACAARVNSTRPGS